MVSYASQIHIHAPVDVVWQILIDLSAYPEWNPFTPTITGKVAAGEAIVIWVRLFGERITRTDHHITHLVPEQQISWAESAPPPWLIYGERHQTLAPLNQTQAGTLYQNRIEFAGVLGWAVGLMMRRAVLRGFTDVQRALKERAERLASPLDTPSSPEAGAGKV